MNEKGYSQSVSTAELSETPRLVLEQPTGDVVVESWDRPEIRVTVDDSEGYFELEQNGATVLVHNRPGKFNVVKFLEPAQAELRELGVEVDRVAARLERQVERQVRRAGRRVNINVDLSAWRGGRDYYVMVPQDCDLNLRTSSGDIRVMGVRGNLFVQTTTGDSRLRDVAGNLITNSASGDISVDGFRGKIGLRTASGDIKSRNLMVSEINASTVSGDLAVDLERTPESAFELKTISGELMLFMPADARFRADIHTISGSINSGYPRGQVDYRSTHKRETVLDVNGGGIPVRLTTVSGDIWVRPRRHEDNAPRDEVSWRESSTSRHGGHPGQWGHSGRTEFEGASTMDLSRNPQYARVAHTPAEPSPERRAAELEILQSVQRGDLTPQEAVQRLSDLENGGSAAPAVAEEPAPTSGDVVETAGEQPDDTGSEAADA